MLFYKICGTLSKFEEPYQSSRWVDVDCVWKWLFWLSVRFQTNASTFFCQHPCKELLQSWAAPQLRSIGENVNMWLDPDWPCLVKDLQLQSPVLISMILAHRLVFMFSPMSSRKKHSFYDFLGLEELDFVLLFDEQQWAKNELLPQGNAKMIRRRMCRSTYRPRHGWGSRGWTNGHKLPNLKVEANLFQPFSSRLKWAKTGHGPTNITKASVS